MEFSRLNECLRPSETSSVGGTQKGFAIRGIVIKGLLFMLFMLAWVEPAAAIPAWARKYQTTCTLCHSAWPALNALGREFKILGYRLPGEVSDPTSSPQPSDTLTLDQISARFVMRPFDKNRDEGSKIRAFHEIEIFFAGAVSRDFSVFAALEGEDEDEFNVFAEHGVLGWHPTEEANVILGWASPFFADPFETFADGGQRMTRSHKGPLDQRFGARERLRSASQWIGFYGRAGGRVFYNLGVSAGGDDPEGGDAKDGFGRIMVEALPGVNLGGFILDGTNETQAVALDFRRAGFDFQIERDSLNLYGMVMHVNDDLLTGGEVSTTVGYIEGFYVFEPGRIPLLVPLVRLDFLDEFTNLTSNLSFYFNENIKTYVEWWQNLDTPGLRKDNRVTVHVDFAF